MGRVGTAVAAVLAAMVSVMSWPAEPEPSVAPGGIVRWTGEGTERCSVLGRSFDPIGSTCWFPVDLLLPQGELRLERLRLKRRETTTVLVSAYPYPTQELTVEPGQVRLSAADQERNRRETRRVASLWPRETEPRRFTLPLGPPLSPLPAAASFGSRRVFNREPRSPHTGVDFTVPRGMAVLAVADGKVVLAEEHFFSGRSVFVDHGGGLISMYFHLEELEVGEGDEVRRGQRVGTVGSTGRATGPHLHFGIRWHGARVDPKLLLGPWEAIREVGSGGSP